MIIILYHNDNKNRLFRVPGSHQDQGYLQRPTDDIFITFKHMPTLTNTHGYACMCACMHTHTHTHVRVHAHTHIHTHTHTHTYTHTHTHTHTHRLGRHEKSFG